VLPRALAAMILSATALVAAAQTYPTKPIRVIVPYPPGGGIDLAARLIATPLGASLGQPVIVENQGGAATMIGTSAVARSAPDGYTLLLTSNGFAVNVMLYKAPSYKVEDFVAVSPVAMFAYVLSVNTSLPARSVRELIDYARREPGKVNAGSVGPGSAIHLLNERLASLAGVAITSVHYRGTAQALTDLVAGQTQILIAPVVTAAGQARSGKTRALAVTSAERSSLLPDVPTFQEAGLPAMTQWGWTGVFAPVRTPAPVVERLNREVANAAASAEVRARFERDGSVPKRMGPEEFASFVREDAAPWERSLRNLNIRLE
jgi:tripartite-type tricarboxylate transporter receptor subunit TctC